MPGTRGRTVEQQISDLEERKARIRAEGAPNRTEYLRIDRQIQELRDAAKRQE
jgi:hypothetical protein